jgi:hypothetical protein
VLEHAGFIFDATREEATVNHDAAVASRGELGREAER